MLSCHSFAAGGKKATQAALDAEIIDRTDAFNILQNQINNIHLQIDSVQVGSFTYEIGQAGPAGGIVFYVTDGGLHGLEAAPEDQNGLSAPAWGCFGTVIAGADGEAVGAGARNTSDILAGCSDEGIAAELADDYALNGYTDWFLPSKDELNLMWRNLADSDGDGENTGPDDSNNLGGFDPLYYWSSTEYDLYNAWGQLFHDGYQDYDAKNDTFGVRAVRAF